MIHLPSLVSEIIPVYLLGITQLVSRNKTYNNVNIKDVTVGVIISAKTFIQLDIH